LWVKFKKGIFVFSPVPGEFGRNVGRKTGRQTKQNNVFAHLRAFSQVGVAFALDSLFCQVQKEQ